MQKNKILSTSSARDLLKTSTFRQSSWIFSLREMLISSKLTPKRTSVCTMLRTNTILQISYYLWASIAISLTRNKTPHSVLPFKLMPRTPFGNINTTNQIFQSDFWLNQLGLTIKLYTLRSFSWWPTDTRILLFYKNFSILVLISMKLMEMREMPSTMQFIRIPKNLFNSCYITKQ